MLYNFRRVPKFYRYIILISSIILFIGLMFGVLVSFFPIQSTTSDINNFRSSRFIAPWPTSSIDLEFQERKRLKRYARAEQKKRLEKQIQKMNLLSVPVYDLSLDDEAELLVDNPKYFPGKTSFLWPILPTERKLTNLSQTASRHSIQLLLPNKNWTSLMEGVYLSAGDELKANIPIIKDRRYLNFYLFPLTPGNVRIILGQYVWAKTFLDEDVQKLQRFSVPINDPTATNIRALSISSSCYILNMSINQNTRNGREPIKVSSNSLLWMPNKNFLMNNLQDDITPDSSQSDEETDEETTDNPDESQQEAKQIPAQEEIKAEPPKEPKHTTPENTVLVDDPLLQTANKQLLVNSEYSTAFGYNVVYIQTPPLDLSQIETQPNLKKIAPNLSLLLQDSTYFDNNIQTFTSPSDIFRQSIYENYSDDYEKNQPLFQYKIIHNESENTYQKFRRYGYKVLSIATPKTLFFPEGISGNKILPDLYNRWLDQTDWEFEMNNMKIDDKQNNSSGLEAIFSTENDKKTLKPIEKSDYTSLSEYLKNLSKNMDKTANWHPNEYRLVSPQRGYAAKAVAAFQNWADTNNQTRFFAHVLLDNTMDLNDSNLNNLKKAFLSMGPFSFTKPNSLRNMAYFSYVDMAIGHVLDTIKAKRIENRTLVFLLIPNKNKPGTASGIYKIPGLIGKKFTSKINSKDIFSTIFSNVGIPTGVNLTKTSSSQDGNMLELNKYVQQRPELKNGTIFSKYTLIIHPNKNLCHPIIWQSSNSQIFGLHSNYPIYRSINTNTLEIYPCSIQEKFVEFTWYQSNTNNQIEQGSSSNSIAELGGQFHFLKNQKEFPEVYFGKELISSKNLLFLFKKPEQQEIKNFFYVENSDLEKNIDLAKKSFAQFDKINKEKNTKVALFITPL